MSFFFALSLLDSVADDGDDMDMEEGVYENEDERSTPIRPERDDSSVVFTKHTGNVKHFACSDAKPTIHVSQMQTSRGR